MDSETLPTVSRNFSVSHQILSINNRFYKSKNIRKWDVVSFLYQIFEIEKYLIKGYSELTIIPLVDTIDSVYLNCKQCSILFLLMKIQRNYA